MADLKDMGLEDVTKNMTEALTGLFGEAAPETLFSTPTRVGDDLVFTAVAWERFGGFGFGGGEGRGNAGEVGSGVGGGGGGASQGRPVAVIRVTRSGVSVDPVIDFTKIGVTVLLGALGVWRALRR